VIEFTAKDRLCWEAAFILQVACGEVMVVVLMGVFIVTKHHTSELDGWNC